MAVQRKFAVIVLVGVASCGPVSGTRADIDLAVPAASTEYPRNTGSSSTPTETRMTGHSQALSGKEFADSLGCPPCALSMSSGLMEVALELVPPALNPKKLVLLLYRSGSAEPEPITWYVTEETLNSNRLVEVSKLVGLQSITLYTEDADGKQTGIEMAITE